MIVEIGKVVEIGNEGTVVLVSQNAACAGCPSRGGCHAIGTNNEARIIAENGVGATIGDLVEIGVGDGRSAAASYVVYVLPVAALFVGAGLGTWIAGKIGVASGANGGISALTGLVFLGAGIVAIRLMDPYLKRKNKRRPRIIRIVEKCR